MEIEFFRNSTMQHEQKNTIVLPSCGKYSFLRTKLFSCSFCYYKLCILSLLCVFLVSCKSYSDKNISLDTHKTNDNYIVTFGQDNEHSMELIHIRGGRFIMGSKRETEHQTTSNEQPHPVILDSDFWLGKYEVTQFQYEYIMGNNPSYFKGERLPVDYVVSWKDAMEFCRRLNTICKKRGILPEGYSFSLPTEAQWEYACRAGTETAYNNGSDNEIDTSEANVNDDALYGNLHRKTAVHRTKEVGSYPPNRWGLHDMHGNVSEWCLDAVDVENFYGTSHNSQKILPEYGEHSVRNPCMNAGNFRVLRGGSWDSIPCHCRSSSRMVLPFNWNPTMEFFKPQGIKSAAALCFLSPVVLISLPVIWPYAMTQTKKQLSFIGFRVALIKIAELNMINHIETNNEVPPLKQNHPSTRDVFKGKCLSSSDFTGKFLVIDLHDDKGDSDCITVQEVDRPPTASDFPDARHGKLWMRRIEPGHYSMGSPESELGHLPEEIQHQVSISKPFYISIFEITQAQWELVAGNNPSYYVGEDRPVESVSYKDLRGGREDGIDWPKTKYTVTSNSFLGRLRAKTGLNFDLPTEAQWEYACRAGTLTALNSGHDISSVYDCVYLSQIGRYAYSERKPSDIYKQHIAVGSLAPNRWNLYDMHGNVAEICRDWNGQYQTDLQVDPHGPDNGVMHFKKKIFHLRVTRGGSWDGDNALRCRSACRSAVEDEGKNNRTGFRIVLE